MTVIPLCINFQDLPDVPELSTFPTHSEDERSFKSSDSNFAFVLRERIIIRNSAADDASSYMDDNPYDEIPGTALVNSLSETEEKVYDEIKEGLINTQLEEGNTCIDYYFQNHNYNLEINGMV